MLIHRAKHQTVILFPKSVFYNTKSKMIMYLKPPKTFSNEVPNGKSMLILYTNAGNSRKQNRAKSYKHKNNIYADVISKIFIL